MSVSSQDKDRKNFSKRQVLRACRRMGDEAEAARSGRCDGCLPPVGAAACAAGRLLRESMGPVPRRAVPGLGDFRAGLSPEKMIPGRGPSLPGRPRDRRISVQHGFVPGIFRSALLTAWPRPSGSFFRQDPLCGQLFPLTGEFPYSTVPGPGTSVRSFPLSGPFLCPPPPCPVHPSARSFPCPALSGWRL